MASPAPVSENLPAEALAPFRAALAPLLRARFWLIACGAFNALLGVLLLLSLIGIPFGAALGWVAFLQFRAAQRLVQAQRDAAGQGLALAEGAMRDIALHFVIQAVLTTLMILFALLLLALFLPLLHARLPLLLPNH